MPGVQIGVFRGAEFISGGFKTKSFNFGWFFAVLENFQQIGRPEHISWNAGQRNTPNEAYRSYATRKKIFWKFEDTVFGNSTRKPQLSEALLTKYVQKSNQGIGHRKRLKFLFPKWCGTWNLAQRFQSYGHFLKKRPNFEKIKICQKWPIFLGHPVQNPIVGDQ